MVIAGLTHHIEPVNVFGQTVEVKVLYTETLLSTGISNCYIESGPTCRYQYELGKVMVIPRNNS